jgi:hypothetical protein
VVALANCHPLFVQSFKKWNHNAPAGSERLPQVADRRRTPFPEKALYAFPRAAKVLRQQNHIIAKFGRLSGFQEKTQCLPGKVVWSQFLARWRIERFR